MPQSGTSRRAWLRPAVALGTIFAAWIATGCAVIGMSIDIQGYAGDGCYSESQSPGFVIPYQEHGEASVAAAYATVFPAGRYCLWLTHDGTIAVEQTGWVSTWVALGFLVLACAAMLALVGTEWWVPVALGMVVPIAGWVVIIITGDTIVSPVFWSELPPIPHRPG